MRACTGTCTYPASGHPPPASSYDARSVVCGVRRGNIFLEGCCAVADDEVVDPVFAAIRFPWQADDEHPRAMLAAARGMRWSKPTGASGLGEKHSGKPADCLIEPDGTVSWSYQAPTPGDLPGANLIFDALAR